MAGKIFVNYRRGDDPGFTHAIYLLLEDEFASNELFMDIEGHIRPGDDFIAVIDRQVASCDVFLAVIGPRWAELLAARANVPEDFVVIEIKSALDKTKRVIPVLVGGAAMPRADDMPQAIRPLARRNAVGLRPERFKADCQGLITAIKESLASAQADREAAAARAREAELAQLARGWAKADEARKKADVERTAAEAQERTQAERIAGSGRARIKVDAERVDGAPDGWFTPGGLRHEAMPGIRLESGRCWPASGLAGAQRRAEQTLAARWSRVPAGDSRAKSGV